MKFLFILFFLIHCLSQIALSIPLPPSSENIADADYTISNGNSDMTSLNTRNIDYYYTPDAPNYGTSPNPIANWIYSIAGGLFSQSNEMFQPPQYPLYGNTFSSTNSAYDQEQWNDPLAHYDRNQSQFQSDTQSYDNIAYADAYDTGRVQPQVTRKVSTIFSDDSKEIKHKLILSPDYPGGTGYISIKKPAKMNQTNSSSKGGTVYYRF